MDLETSAMVRLFALSYDSYVPLPIDPYPSHPLYALPPLPPLICQTPLASAVGGWRRDQ